MYPFTMDAWQVLLAQLPATTQQVARSPWALFGIGALGAVCLELVKFYEYRGKLTERQLRAMARSLVFWGPVLGMIFVSGAFAWILFADSPQASLLQIATAGLAAQSIFRQLGAAQVANTPTKLGESDRITLADVFR